MQVTTASDAEPWMLPPPPLGDVDRKVGGKSKALASQSMTTVSSSVQAGLQSQLNAGAVKAAEYISPSIEGYVTPAGKNAMNFGDCQCVRPGIILEAMSGWMSGHD